MKCTNWLILGTEGVNLIRYPNARSEVCLVYRGAKIPAIGRFNFTTGTWESVVANQPIPDLRYFWPLDPPPDGQSWLRIVACDSPVAESRDYTRRGWRIAHIYSSVYLAWREGEPPVLIIDKIGARAI